jgi:hypothetical protein
VLNVQLQQWRASWLGGTLLTCQPCWKWVLANWLMETNPRTVLAVSNAILPHKANTVKWDRDECSKELWKCVRHSNIRAWQYVHRVGIAAYACVARYTYM